MFILDYEYIKATNDLGDHLEVPGVTREDTITNCFLPNVSEIVLTQRTAVLYAGGFSIHQSETRDLPPTDYRYNGSISAGKSSMVIKESTVNSLHKWIGSMVNNELVNYATINSNTCASAMFSLFEAEMLLKSQMCDEVIIIAEERTSANTLRIFKEHRIDITCSDGFAVIRLTRDKGTHEIVNTKWSYSYNTNPFRTTKEGYSAIDTTEVDNINPHGTGTESNNLAEADLLEGRNVLAYKKDIGHSQGVSGLLELCMTIEDPKAIGDTLCVASGLGGFYGSCILRKH